MARKAKAEAKVSPDALKAALEMKAKGLLTDEQFALLTGGASPAPAPVAPAPAPEPPKAVVSGSGHPGVVPALASSGKKSAAVAAGLAKLAGLGGAKPASKSKTPDVDIPALAQAVEEFVQVLGEKKTAEARLGTLGAEIAEKAEAERVAISRRLGALQASLYVNRLVTYIQPHGYKTVDPDKEAKLRVIFGDEYDSFFLPRLEVKVVDTDALAALYEALESIAQENGIDLGKVFASEPTLAPTEALTAARVMRPEVEAKFAKAVEEGLIEAKKYTVKEK